MPEMLSPKFTRSIWAGLKWRFGYAAKHLRLAWQYLTVVGPGWPCRCGEIHRGTYFQEDWIHHNCFHRERLHWLSDPGDTDHFQMMCVGCGEVFDVDDPRIIAGR